MKKYFLLGMLLPAFLTAAWAQDGFVPQNTQMTIDVFDRNGKSFVNPASDVEGSPFYKDDWKLAAVIINTNRRYDSVKVRINLASQEVHILDPNKSEMSLDKGYVKQVLLPGRVPSQSILFQSGFPAVDEQDANNFYEVLSQGKLWLLHSMRKLIFTERNEMAGETKREYRLYEAYYLFDGSVMQRIKREKAAINGKEMKFKSIDELRKAVDAYNAS